MTTAIGVVMTEHLSAPAGRQSSHRPSAHPRTPTRPTRSPPSQRRAGRFAGGQICSLATMRRSVAPSASRCPASCAAAWRGVANCPSSRNAAGEELAGCWSAVACGAVRIANDADAIAAGVPPPAPARPPHPRLDHRQRHRLRPLALRRGRLGGATSPSPGPRERFCGCGGAGHSRHHGLTAPCACASSTSNRGVFACPGSTRCREFVDLWHAPGRRTAPSSTWPARRFYFTATTSASRTAPLAQHWRPWSR